MDRYLLRQIALFFVMLLLILTGLAWMLQILSMLKILIQYNVSIGGFMGLTTMLIPYIMTLIIPFAIFIATMFVYNRMISDREITVMMGAGLSPARIAHSAFLLTGVITAVHLLFNLWLVPASQNNFYTKQWEIRYGLAHLALQESSFNRLADDMVVFVDRVNDKDMSNLMLFDNRNPKNQIIAVAQRGKLIATNRGMSLVMDHGSIQSMGDAFVVGTFDTFDMDMNISDNRAENAFRARRISSPALIKSVSMPTIFSETEYKSLIAEVANRFLMPLMDIILVLIASIVLLKSSLLRRKMSIAPAIATIAMTGAMALFMTISGVITSVSALIALAAGQIITIICLIMALIKK
ncbi:MAG: LptF/LptG family permease [Rickettsiales bacterium]|nr:LptF/LptG family permease [Rickettsiales bacterium]